MINQIPVKTALNLTNSIFIDVRSPNEFYNAHIPGAINIPVLNNEERTKVGKVYRHISKDKAKILGLNYASKKLCKFYERAIELKKDYDNIVVYCWRGGLRSQSICNVLNSLSLSNVYQLNDGFKGYRKFTLNYLNNIASNYSFVVLHGLTGVGKTIILNKLEKSNIPTIDLENYAKNAGSVFGNLLYPHISPSQKQFESLLFKDLYYNNRGYIVIESESKRIGNINVPDSVMESMKNGIHILIETNLKNRIENIYQSYITTQNNSEEEVIKSINHLKKRIGNKNVDILNRKVSEKNYKYVIEFLLKNYYDPLYEYSINKIEHYDLIISYDHLDDTIKKITDFLYEKNLY